MTQSSAKPQLETVAVSVPAADAQLTSAVDEKAARDRAIAVLRLLWHQRRFLARVTAWGLAGATLIAFLIPKRYESTARLMPPDSQSVSGMAMLAALSSRTGELGGVAGDLLGLKSSSALFVGILRSRTVEDRLIRQFGLQKIYWARRMEDARENLEGRTQISEDRKSGIITIKVTDRDPQRAAGMAQAYVEELNRLVAELTTSAAHRERVFLEERLKAVKQDLDAAAQEFGQFASKNTAIDIKEQGKAMVTATATLQGQLIAAESELKGLEQIYSDNNVRVRSVKARIAELKRQLQRLGGNEMGGVPGMSHAGDISYPSIRRLPLLGITYADLYRRTTIQETVYEVLTRQYELAKVEEAKEIPSVKVLDLADVPEKKTYPPRLLIMLLGTMLSVLIGMGCLLGKSRWEELDEHEPRRVLALEVFQAAKAQLAWVTLNGSGLRGMPGRMWMRLRRGEAQTKTKPE